MNWQEIKVSEDNTYFLFNGKPIFNKHFIEVLKFHSPGLAPVIDNTGAYHIDTSGNQLYTDRYARTFGFYCNRSAVIQNENWFHITDKGTKAYLLCFAWAGNYQENLCTVRDFNNKYFHINLNGEIVYSQQYLYAGDYKDGLACVKTTNGFYKHIDSKGNYLYEKEFEDLGVFHKNFATAKDNKGWHHIDKRGVELYPQRYSQIESFYNGFAMVTDFGFRKSIINEKGDCILSF